MNADDRARLILPISLGLAALALLAGQAMQPAPALDRLPLCEETTSFPCYSDFGDEVILHP